MKHVEKCGYCGGTVFTRLFGVKSRGFDCSIIRCGKCGIAYLDPALDENDISSYYSKDYFNDHTRPETLREREANGASLMALLEKYIPKTGRVLDFGACTGSQLSAFKKAGWEAVGIEIAEFARATAEKLYGITMYRDPWSVRFKDGYFDLIMMNQVIEHLPEQAPLLEEFHRILKPGGTLFVSTPNFGSGRAKCMKADWPSLKADEHLTFFTVKTLRKTLEKAGFRVIASDTMQAALTTPHFVKVLGNKGADKISRFANLVFPRLKRSVRNLLGKIVPGDNINMFATKD